MTSFETLLANNGFTKPQGSFEWQSGEIRAVVDDRSLQFRRYGGSYGDLASVFNKTDGSIHIQVSEELRPTMTRLAEKYGLTETDCADI